MSNHDQCAAEQTWLFPLDKGERQLPASPTADHARRSPNRQRAKIELAAESWAKLVEALAKVEQRLDAVESLLQVLVGQAPVNAPVKEFYTTAEAARHLGKRPYTVREWCRLKRVRAEKTWAGRGQDDEWRISHEELLRIQNEGLLSLEKLGRTSLPRRAPR